MIPWLTNIPVSQTRFTGFYQCGWAWLQPDVIVSWASGSRPAASTML